MPEERFQHSMPELLKRVSAAIYDDGYDSAIGPKAALRELVEKFEEEVDNAANEYALLFKRFQRLKEQFDALHEIAVRVSEADNQRLGAEGEPGFEAMREMEDALAALHQNVGSNPAKSPEHRPDCGRRDSHETPRECAAD